MGRVRRYEDHAHDAKHGQGNRDGGKEIDHGSRSRLWSLVARERAEQALEGNDLAAMGVVASTDAEELVDICDRVIVMQRGRQGVIGGGLRVLRGPALCKDRGKKIEVG
jgi:energy-coupling factor transporter ATP-binding protein EcfA2